MITNHRLIINGDILECGQLQHTPLVGEEIIIRVPEDNNWYKYQGDYEVVEIYNWIGAGEWKVELRLKRK